MSIVVDELVPFIIAEACDQFFSEGFTPISALSSFPDWQSILRSPSRWPRKPRSEAETDERCRHLITYTLLRSGNHVFRYRRGRSGSEDRLHGKLSIGVGGHVNSRDLEGWWPAERDQLKHAALREVHEELRFKRHQSMTPIGFLKGSATPVDRVHLGMVFEMTLRTTTATAREDCLADAEWVPVEQVRRERERLESWSRMLVEAGVV